jgi:hypothetical protein
MKEGLRTTLNYIIKPTCEQIIGGQNMSAQQLEYNKSTFTLPLVSKSI